MCTFIGITNMYKTKSLESKQRQISSNLQRVRNGMNGDLISPLKRSSKNQADRYEIDIKEEIKHDGVGRTVSKWLENNS